MTLPAAQAYPWRALPRVTRAEAAGFARARRWLTGHAALDHLATALHRLLGATVEIGAPAHVSGPEAPEVERTTPSAGSGGRGVDGRAADSAASPYAASVHVAGPGGGPTAGAGRAFVPAVAVALVAPALPGAAVVVEVEGALAADLVARALRRTPPDVIDPGRPVGERLAGALAAVVAAAARAAAPDVPLRVAAAGDPERVRADHAAPGDVDLRVAVRVGGAAHSVRVRVPAALEDPGVTPFDRRALARMGDAPLALPVVAAASHARAAEVAAIAPGDVWLPGGWSPSSARAAALAPGRSEMGVRAEIGEDGRLVVRGERVALPWEGSMVEAGEDALAEALGDVPVVVRVEVGSAEMPARAWAALAPGDVVPLGRRIGEAAILRVGGVEVARGELVELDGEIGVRVLTRSREVR